MFVLIVGAGRVGSAVARGCSTRGTRSPSSTRTRCARAPGHRPGRTAGRTPAGSFTVGTALEIDALLEAGIEQADAFVASTDGDNTNLVIAQIAKRRFNVPNVVVRVLDPARAAWYAEQGLHTICPTQPRSSCSRTRSSHAAKAAVA